MSPGQCPEDVNKCVKERIKGKRKNEEGEREKEGERKKGGARARVRDLLFSNLYLSLRD